MAKMTIDVPDELRGLFDVMMKSLEGAKTTLATTVGGRAIDYSAVEKEVSENASAIERECHRAILQGLDIDVATVLIGGVRYNRVGRCEDSYHTLAGSVSVERSLYRASGERGGQPGGKVVDSVSLRAGVVADGWLPRTARAMSHELQRGTSREAATATRETLRLPYSRSSFERVAHVVAALSVAAKRDIEDVLIERYELPEKAASVSVSLDRVSIPMEEPRPRPVGRPRKGAAKRPVERNFRMAYCATVTVHDGKGEALHTIRYGCMPDGDIEAMRDRLVADVTMLRAKAPSLKIQLLCDGAPEMWNLLEAGFTADRFGETVYRLVDLPHLLEKLASAAGDIEDRGGALAQAQVARWKLGLCNRAEGARWVLSELEDSGFERESSDCPVHAAITYLRRHALNDDRMSYANARKLGLPLASGPVEATCKSLFALRMKRCGARWKSETGQHILHLRALALSDRWEPAVELTLRPLAQAVRPAA
jgi:hypothetical protein